jgi:hypothetical protein
MPQLKHPLRMLPFWPLRYFCAVFGGGLRRLVLLLLLLLQCKDSCVDLLHNLGSHLSLQLQFQSPPDLGLHILAVLGNGFFLRIVPFSLVLFPPLFLGQDLWLLVDFKTAVAAQAAAPRSVFIAGLRCFSLQINLLSAGLRNSSRHWVPGMAAALVDGKPLLIMLFLGCFLSDAEDFLSGAEDFLSAATDFLLGAADFL